MPIYADLTDDRSHLGLALVAGRPPVDPFDDDVAGDARADA
jgi:hypothetical protein